MNRAYDLVSIDVWSGSRPGVRGSLIKVRIGIQSNALSYLTLRRDKAKQLALGNYFGNTHHFRTHKLQNFQHSQVLEPGSDRTNYLHHVNIVGVGVGSI